MLPRLHLNRCSSCRENQHRRSRSWRWIIKTALSATVLMGGLTGCTTIHNAHRAITNNSAWDETVIVLRNRSYSAKAWHRRKHHFCRQQYIKDFCAGFRTGYEDVAGGSDGCTPAFPPKEYWSWEYQSGEGQSRTSAWLAGYPHGVQAAEEDGVANWTQLQMSTGLQAQYQQAGMFDHQGALYPIPSGDAVGMPQAAGEISDAVPLPPGTIPSGAELIPSAPGDAIPAPPAAALGVE